MDSVIKSWVFNLPLRMQSVLMSAIRGADGFNKEDKSKHLVRALRGLLLNNADPTNSFIKDDLTDEQIEAFASDIDHYYVHFLMHFTHATEIVGYKHPDHLVRGKWLAIYKRICKSLHLNFETEAQLDIRLGHTPEYLAEKEREKEKRKDAAQKVLIPDPKRLVIDEEARRKSQEDRPLDLDFEHSPVPLHIDDGANKPLCTCGHAYSEHYQLLPITAPDLYECSTGKCSCKKYTPKVEAPPAQKKAISKTCVCGHSLEMHQLPNTMNRCHSRGCHCTNFVDRDEARRTQDAGTGTSRHGGRNTGSS